MGSDAKHVVIAPDAFKGGPNAVAVANAIATGWNNVRPFDHVTLLPLADGGEGTVDVLFNAHPNATRVAVTDVTGPDGTPTDAAYCLLGDGVAVIELASSSGLPKMHVLDPRNATTRGLGEVIAHALDRGAQQLLIGLGGSASTDAGTGALYALGLQAHDANGQHVPDGGAALIDVADVNVDNLVTPPRGGVVLLSDVSAPLTGPTGAAHVFGPQKGADAACIAELDRALTHFASLVGGKPDDVGAGAAGGTGFGLSRFLGATLKPGGIAIAELVGLPDALQRADVIVTGEGAIDASTFTGKVVHTVWDLARTHSVPVIAIGGKVQPEVLAGKAGITAISTSIVAGSVAASMSDPIGAITQAASVAAMQLAP